jgi:hypothetical protein
MMTSGLVRWESEKNHLMKFLMLHRKMMKIFCENDFQAGVFAYFMIHRGFFALGDIGSCLYRRRMIRRMDR